MSLLTTETLFDTQPYLKQAPGKVIAVNEDLIALDQTIFFPVGGGQPGDRGTLCLESGELRTVLSTFRDRVDSARIWLQLDEPLTLDSAGSIVETTLDWSWRYDNMRIHTCLHLLCSLIKSPVTGCKMTANKGSLDFDMPELEMSREDMLARLKELVKKGIKVSATLVSPSEREGILSLVRNRYALPPDSAEAIKIITVDGVDIQPCGGTHLDNTAEIEDVLTVKVENKGKANRRITVEITPRILLN
jgi:misacylated tRNA(Ala) deacylase